MTRRRPTTPPPAALPLVAALLAALAAAACGGGGASPPPAPSPLDLAAESEREVRTTARVGVRPELGAGADALFADIDAARAAGLPVIPLARLAGPAPLPTFARSRASVVGQSATSALGGLLLLLEPGVNQAAVNNATGTKHLDLPGGAADSSFVTTLTQSGSSLAAGIIQKVVYTAKDGRTVTELATGSAEVQLCPDAAGRVPLTYTFHFDVAAPGGGVQIDVSGTGTGTVGDDAGLQSWSSDSRVSYAAQGSALPVTGSNASVHLTHTFDWASTTLTAHATEVVQDTTVDSIATALVSVASTMPGLLERYILEKAQARWQAGECVEIVVSGASDANTVALGSTTAFTGTVHHKIEGVDLPLPIRAALSGTQSLAPTAPTPSPVSYAYVAGTKDAVLSTANLETRSRRGVGRKAVAFTTSALGAYAGTVDFSCSATTTSTASTASWAGSATLRLAVSSVSGGGGILKPDAATGGTTFSAFTTDDANETCALVGTGSGGPAQILGTLVLLSTPAEYYFNLVAQGSGTMRCTSKVDHSVTTATAPLASDMTTSPAPGVLTWVPAPDLTVLTGTAHSHSADSGGVLDCDTTWSLTRQ